MNYKKKVLCLLIVTLFFSFSSIAVADAAAPQRVLSKETTYLDDGSYFETIIYVNTEINTRANNTKTGTKTTTYKADGKVLWYVSVTGSFTYTGSSSKCTSASVKAESYNQYWKISNKSSSYSGNKAKGKATAKLYYGPLPAATINKEVVLSCDSNGNLS
ncbi:hypothetical protein INF30_12255 [Lachnospiraceae bacterium DSM 108991]|uniref:Uncharacterized protein n=1 Tax=Claveliimonas monacensis TaxID=2779351 RepID=A0ABR9RM20_9FIRM|nr:hypothetical protein [Claveliimonas monacensis]MBE5064026.1 hypothetical protein [Claveliimonas monacensis]